MQDLTPDQEKKLRIAYKQTFGTDAGQAVLKDLQMRCFKYKSTIPVPGMPSMGETTESNEGARQVLLTIEELMSDEGIQKLTDVSGKEQ